MKTLYVKGWAAVLLALLAHPFTNFALGESNRPNILLIVADDLGYGELSCQGNPQVPTPNIDSIAKNGVRFTSGYVTAPVCSPSRAGLMTGRYQVRFGYDINPTGKMNLVPGIGLPTNQVTLPDMLKQRGYATAAVGKWHLGPGASFNPTRRGFDSFYGFLFEGHFYAPTATPGVSSFLRTNTVPDTASRRFRIGNVTWSIHTGNNEPAYDFENPIVRNTTVTAEKQFLTDAWAREAIPFIRSPRSQPFFLYLAYNAPHSPMQSLDSYIARFPQIEDLHRRVFAGMVAHLDESVGRVLATLRELDLEENTLIFFLSDNGGPTRELTSSNAPLSGGKGMLLEGGIRIPFMVQWKGHLPAGKAYAQPVISLDIAASALAAAGANPPPGVTLDGVNLLPYLTGEKSGLPHDTLFWKYGQKCAIRRGDWKLVKEAIQSGFRLFDLKHDTGETNDLTAANPSMARDLQKRLDEWLAELPMPIAFDGVAKGGEAKGGKKKAKE